MSVSTPTLITFLIYIAAMILIGFIAYRATKNFSDYILGGRSLGSFVTALSAGASDMSGWLLMGLPGAIFVAGLSESWIAIGLIIGAWLNWLFVAGRLRVHTEHNHNALTLPDYFSHRFEDESRMLRIFSALVILVFFTIYCASGVVAGLVAITPAAGTVGPMGALIIGLVSGVVCFFCATSLKRKLGYDDSLDAFGVHGVGGIVGALLTGLAGGMSRSGCERCDDVRDAATDLRPARRDLTCRPGSATNAACHRPCRDFPS